MPRKKLVEFNTNSILEAAEALFEEKGFEATSVDDIAKTADMSKSTLYVYFKSKELIWDSIVCMYMEELLEDAKKAAEGKAKFEERYYGLCFDIAGLFEKHPIFYKGMLGKISLDMEQEVYKKIYDVGEQINEAIADFIRSGIEEGAVRKDIDIYTAVFVMWPSISGIVKLAIEKEEYFRYRFNTTKDEYLKKAFGMLLEGVV